jgi:hypothetical protein
MAARYSQVRESTARASTENILGILKHVIECDMLAPFVKKFHDLPPYDNKSDHVEIIVDDDHFCDVLDQLHKKLCCPGDDAVYSLEIQAELFQTVCDYKDAFQAFARLLEMCLRSELLYQETSPSIPVLVTRILCGGCSCNTVFARMLCKEGEMLETILYK